MPIPLSERITRISEESIFIFNFCYSAIIAEIVRRFSNKKFIIFPVFIINLIFKYQFLQKLYWVKWMVSSKIYKGFQIKEIL